MPLRQRLVGRRFGGQRESTHGLHRNQFKGLGRVAKRERRSPPVVGEPPDAVIAHFNLSALHSDGGVLALGRRGSVDIGFFSPALMKRSASLPWIRNEEYFLIINHGEDPCPRRELAEAGVPKASSS